MPYYANNFINEIGSLYKNKFSKRSPQKFPESAIAYIG
ncbi:hypothetical protein GXM_04947 [Nostoc sphaeroides CCNUC1]|uniref:Uncharacterized protein n=1 Tax=Nostoc sphaeroides CCNUC1 TaxID=2653204 RepID=A0A5P8W3Y8_9NOSO|nr:hypothetical protein GXM_04947 [Nostoc sphaeroides CCNUC1]